MCSSDLHGYYKDLDVEIEPSDTEEHEIKFSKDENSNAWTPDQESVTSREYKVLFTWLGDQYEGAAASLTVNVRECAGDVQGYIDDIKMEQEVIDAYEELESSIPWGAWYFG